MARQIRVVVIKDHQISVERIDASNSSADAIHNIIGNLFTTAFSLNPFTDDNMTGFCDDEGLLNGSKPNALCGPTLQRSIMEPIHGPIVIVGGTDQGETRSLTETEAARFRLLDVEPLQIMSLMATGTVLPLLVYNERIDASMSEDVRRMHDSALIATLPQLMAQMERDLMA